MYNGSFRDQACPKYFKSKNVIYQYKITDILSVSSKFFSLYQKCTVHFTPSHYLKTMFEEHQ